MTHISIIWLGGLLWLVKIVQRKWLLFIFPFVHPVVLTFFLCICEREDVRYVLCTSASVDHAILFFWLLITKQSPSTSSKLHYNTTTAI